MECIKKCVDLSSILGGESEFGSLSYSPLSLSQIRERQVWNEAPLSYVIGSEAKGAIILNYGYVCQRGLYPDDPEKENQDAFKIVPSFDGESQMILMGAFDGHGEYGDECSAYVRDNIEEFLSQAREDHGKDLEKAFRAAFRKLNSSMHYCNDFSDQLSGTTACVALFERSAVWVANVGDSRAIIGKISKGALVATPLSTDQTPYRKDERERIRAAGGEIMSVDQRDGHVPMHDNWDIDLGAETDTDGDPPRVWVPGKDKPGCAFTRSIGDNLGERVGVIADPELTKKELKEHDKFVCICSDGVWEFLTNQAVCNMVALHEDPLAASRAVVAESYRLWLQFDVRTDDITMILTFIDFERKTKSAQGAALKAVPKGRGSIRGSISIGGDALQKSGARPVRRGLSKAKREVIASLAAEDEAESAITSMDELPVIEKTSDEMQRIRESLEHHFLFASLASAQKDKAYQAMRRMHVEQGQTIYKMGETADAFYVLDSGEYSLTTRLPNGTEEASAIKATAGLAHPTFGELGLMYSKPRPGTVVVTKPGLLWAIDRTVFKAVIRFGGAGSNQKSRALETLKSIDILRSLSGDMLKEVAAGLEEVTFAPGEYIVRQGDQTQSLYLIMEGHVRCTAKMDPSGADELLMELSAGAYFGERSLLLNMPRAANVIADRRTTCLYMSKQMFEKNLGPLQAIIDKDRKQREHVAKRRRALQVELGVEHVELGDFALQGVATEPDFGQWVLATCKGAAFTIKAVSKQRATSRNEGARVLSEARLAARIVEQHRFVPYAVQTLMSPAYLLTAFKTQVATGLHEALQDYGPFDEATTLFYAANIFLGLEHLHGCDVAYRNVTPEAIMLGPDGYAMLMDTRFAKEVDGGKLYDLCGLAPYLAPEQVSGMGHTHAVDYWALGILIFEMMTERTPFAGSSNLVEEEIYSRIASHFPGALVYPDVFSLELVDILDKLLEPSTAQRLSTSKAFRSNPWLEVVKWDELERAAVTAPFASEMAKLLAEHLQKGPKKCLPEPPYSGSSWFDKFTSQLDPASSQSFVGDSGHAADKDADEKRLSISGFGAGTAKKDKKGKVKEVVL